MGGSLENQIRVADIDVLVVAREVVAGYTVAQWN